jgi:hypothetical protein
MVIMVINSNLYTTAENKSHRNPFHHHFFVGVGRKSKKSPNANLGNRSSWCEIHLCSSWGVVRKK